MASRKREVPPPGSGPALLRAAIEAAGQKFSVAAATLGVSGSTLSEWISDTPRRPKRPKDHHRNLIELRYGVSPYAWENAQERGERLVAQEYSRAG